MNTFKLTKKNLLMLKDMANSFDLIKNIVYAEELNVLPYPAEDKIRDIRSIMDKFGKEYGNL